MVTHQVPPNLKIVTLKVYYLKHHWFWQACSNWPTAYLANFVNFYYILQLSIFFFFPGSNRFWFRKFRRETAFQKFVIGFILQYLKFPVLKIGQNSVWWGCLPLPYMFTLGTRTVLPKEEEVRGERT